eukprot:CAMPEP_0197591086 /NCGR_PEP_ID=MMETSP1326-20131121/12824_1 /TAXON_ID=1155430 /ORGANISM="Genus nov. species nov., Strain RCC2288" /LENGTH=159 /DNA_ID=CAMNT_0043156445 /DNA_START=116 /DNA_END=592 /DNA_ORIENTATION=+
MSAFASVARANVAVARNGAGTQRASSSVVGAAKPAVIARRGGARSATSTVVRASVENRRAAVLELKDVMNRRAAVLNKLAVAELKLMVQDRQLKNEGGKAELVGRLLEHEFGVTIVTNAAAPAASNDRVGWVGDKPAAAPASSGAFSWGNESGSRGNQT